MTSVKYLAFGRFSVNICFRGSLISQKLLNNSLRANQPTVGLHAIHYRKPLWAPVSCKNQYLTEKSVVPPVLPI